MTGACWLAAFRARDADALVEESRIHFEHLKRAITAFRDDVDVFKPDGPGPTYPGIDRSS